MYTLDVTLSGNRGSITKTFDNYREALIAAFEFENNFLNCKWNITGHMPEVLQ